MYSLCYTPISWKSLKLNWGFAVLSIYFKTPSNYLNHLGYCNHCWVPHSLFVNRWAAFRWMQSSSEACISSQRLEKIDTEAGRAERGLLTHRVWSLCWQLSVCPSINLCAAVLQRQSDTLSRMLCSKHRWQTSFHFPLSLRGSDTPHYIFSRFRCSPHRPPRTM